MRVAPRVLGSAVLAALLGACAHDRVVLTAAEGPAPARVERPGLLRAHLRSRARALRRAPPGPPLFLPSGMPDIQRPHPEWTGPDHAHELPGTIKRLGEHLVLLHGSKLLVVSLADLRLRAAHDLGHAFQPAMFVHRDQVLVILRHLDRRRLRHEVRRFKIAGDGALTRLRSVHLRSDVRGLTGDARLAGDALVLHIQGALGRRTPDLLGLPAIRRAGRWRPLVRAAALQRPLMIEKNDRANVHAHQIALSDATGMLSFTNDDFSPVNKALAEGENGKRHPGALRDRRGFLRAEAGVSRSAQNRHRRPRTCRAAWF